MTIDALARQVEAVVDEIVPSADPGSRSFLVKVGLAADADLFPGMFGRLLVPVGQRRILALPSAALTQAGQLDFVMVKTPQGPVRRYVRLGSHASDKRVEIVSGLAPGEEVILPGP